MSSYSCPECTLPATVLDRFTLSSSTGEEVEHVRISCPAQHHFLCAADRLTKSDSVTRTTIPAVPVTQTV